MKAESISAEADTIDPVAVARDLARARIAAEAADHADAARKAAWRSKIKPFLLGGVFVVMLFERAVNGGWF